MDGMIQLEGLGKSIGGKPILREIGLGMGAGEALALVGPSGSGKTTLLRLIAGHDLPSQGRVLLGGIVASDPLFAIPPHRRGIGMVSQRPCLWPHMTVAENVAFGLARLPRAEVVGRVAKMLELVRLTGLEGRRPHQLSGGEAQRVALARAVAPRPRLLLLDEPLSGLDPDLHSEMLGLFRLVREETAATALYVSHNHEEAAAVTDKVAVLKSGRLDFHGDWAEARRQGRVR